MPRSASVSVPKRLSFELEDALPRGMHSPGPREYDSWPCDSFFLLPDAVLAMDAGAFRADLKALDPVLSASLPDWPLEEADIGLSPVPTTSPSVGMYVDSKFMRNYEPEKRPFTLLHNHKGLLVRSSGKGTVLIGGGGDTNEGSSTISEGGGLSTTVVSSSTGSAFPATNGPTKTTSPQSESHQKHNPLKASSAVSKDQSQKDGIEFDLEIMATFADEPYSLPGPNELFFGGADRSSGPSYKDREGRVRQLRERQQHERQQKLEELKEQAAAAQRFREQQEAVRRQRLDDMKSKDSERRCQVEERKKLIQQAEQGRREAALRKTAEREHRLELKRRQERSNVVFAFGSSTPRMLDPKENLQSYFGSRRATSTTNVNLTDSSSSVRRSSECQEPELSRKRATSAHSLNRKPDGEETTTQRPFVSPPTAARRRTDLLPCFPSLRDSNSSTRSSPRHRSPGRAHSLGRLDQLARPRPQRPPSLAPLHESPSSREKRMTPARTMSKSMSHLGPHHARTPIGPATDGAGVPVADGSLDRRSSRSSLALAHPRMTRSEMLRLSKLRGGTVNAQGVRSGTVTPGSTSRPTSALSQASGGSQVMLRNRTSPKKPRPLSIAGSTLSSADKPRDSPAVSIASPASPRESRSIERKLSNGNITSKPLRAKSVGSDRSAPSTPSKTPRGTTPKRTPAQVKAESAAKKAAADRNKATPKLRSTPKTTPLQSPSVESKALPGSEKVVMKEEDKPKDINSEVPDASLGDVNIEVAVASVEIVDLTSQEASLSDVKETDKEETFVSVASIDVNEVTLRTELLTVDDKVEQIETTTTTLTEDEKSTTTLTEDDKSSMTTQRAADKPVTGYASEEDYKAALAEKRRQAREAKEREIEMERQRKLEEEEKERREEEEYLRLMEDQRKAEEERLRKAIEEAERQRLEENLKRDEEEKQRIETEKIELQKKQEAEEKMKKEEEERQLRKSRVAAIMSRTRGKGSAASTPSKSEPKTPSDEIIKNLNDSLMSGSMTESLINDMSSSMTDSMIVQAIESHQVQKSQHLETEKSPTELLQQPPPSPSSQPPSDVSSQLTSDLSSQPLSDVSSQGISDVDSNSKTLIDSHSETLISGDFTITKTSTLVSSEKSIPLSNVEDIISGVASVNLLETHMNGNPPLPMDTTPTSQTVDLLGSFNGVNGISHNGVDSRTFPSTQKHDNQFGSLNPFISTSQTILTTEVKTDPFDQIIDLNQAKLTNEDAVNSNPPPPPIIAFEENLNRKSQQAQETSSNVPDLLL